MDDNIPHHPKFLKAGPLASWLWVCGNCYCNRYLTDGFISHEVLPTLGQVPRVTKQAAILVLAGLWDAVDGGYTVHHFHDHNPKASDVKAKREHDRLRKESDRNPRGQTEDSAKNPSSPAPAIPIPSQSHPIPSLEEKTEERAPFRQQTPIIGRNPHRDHAACDETQSRCVPAALHHKFQDLLSPKYNGDRDLARKTLEMWYPTVWAVLPAGFVMGDAFKFWQPRFDAAFATVVEPVKQVRDYAAENRAQSEAVLKLLHEDDARRAAYEAKS